MPVTQHPLHRSVHAELPHTALALGRDDQTLVRVRVLAEISAWMNADAGYPIASIKADALVVQPKIEAMHEFGSES